MRTIAHISDLHFGYNDPLLLGPLRDALWQIRPNVLVKGGDYTVETVVGHAEVLAAGGRVEIVPTVEGFSTTNLVKKLQSETPEVAP